MRRITAQILLLFRRVLETAIVQNLERAINKSTDIEEKDIIRLKSAIMINSMVFFAEAKLYYEENKWREEGVELLRQGCELLADSVNEILRMAAVKTPSMYVSASKLLEGFTGKQGFISKLIERLVLKNQKQIEFYKMRNEFNRFVYLLVKKIESYADMFGNSIILAELIERYKPDLVEADCGNSPFRPYVIRPKYGGFRFILSIILSVVTSVNFYNSGFTRGFILICLVTVLIGYPVYIDIIVCLPKKLFLNLIYSVKLIEYNNKKCKIIERYDDLVKTLRGYNKRK